MTGAAPAAEAPGGGIPWRRWARNWRTGRGLLRSLLMYHGVPFKIRRLAELYRPFVEPGDLCFDVGAHVGDRTQALRRLGARVVAIEPQPACLGILRWMFRHDADVTVVAAGVGEVEGVGSLLVSERTPTVSSLSPAWIDSVRGAPRFAGVTWDDQTPVRVTTLDALIQRFGRPAFCKLDVEGSELAALMGLSQPIPCVTFEYIPAQRRAAQTCLARLEFLAPYEYNWTERETPRLRSAQWLTPEAIASQVEGQPDGAHSGDIFARLKRTQ